MPELVHPWLDRGDEGRRALVRQMRHAEQKHTEEIENQCEQVMAGEDGSQPKKLKIVWAEQDTWIALDTGEEVRRRMNPAEWVVVKDAGHLIMVDQPEAVMYEISSWLAKVTV